MDAERMNLGPLRATQRAIAAKAELVDSPVFSDITRIGGFSVTFAKEGPQEKVIAGAVILDFPSMKVLEKKTITLDAPMKYIPGYEAFRIGPVLLQLYYELEYDPQVIFVEGVGSAHPVGAGLATYLGVELEKPVIGVSKAPTTGELAGDDLFIEGERVGVMVHTKEHANKVLVSPGHLVSIDTAAEWVKKTIVQPHKRPEPLHIASRMAKKTVGSTV